MATKIQFRGDISTVWTSVNPILGEREMALETDTNQFKIGDGINHWNDLPYGGVQGPAGADGVGSTYDYGNGGDGDLVLSSGTVTPIRDMYYNNVTITGTGSLRVNGFRIFIKGILDISNAPADAISILPNHGSNATNATGGAAGAVIANGSIAGASVGVAGANGTTGVGAQAGGATTAGNNGGASGQTRGGGTSGSGNAGGAVGSGVNPVSACPIQRFCYDLIRGVGLILGGSTARGGASGGGDGTFAGGGGGGSGTGGGVLGLWAKTINRGSSTAAGAISARGGNGGNGANGLGGNAGAGAGAGGAGGGWIVLYYDTLTGTTATNALDASGGNGGAGGNGAGTGQGAVGSSGGSGGRIFKLCTKDLTSSSLFGGAGDAGGTSSGSSGGNGGAGNLTRMDI